MFKPLNKSVTTAYFIIDLLSSVLHPSVANYKKTVKMSLTAALLRLHSILSCRLLYCYYSLSTHCAGDNTHVSVPHDILRSVAIILVLEIIYSTRPRQCCFLVQN